ncbi:MAG: hypothetical protein M3Y79_06780 [Pseudomonadota bacterium]|nr:hypothetical protein [Pseudomonadota bacterium]
MAKAKKKAKGKALAADAPQFEWSSTNLACVATYHVLEGDQFLDQFEDVRLPFEDAADALLCDLRYFPHTLNAEDLLPLIAFEMGKEFLALVADTYVVFAEDPGQELQDMVQEISDLFASSEATFSDLAKVTDKILKFEQE